jgi:uncharacterized protein (DUF3084 family)
MESKTCSHCFKEFEGNDRRKYCSMACAQVGAKEGMRTSYLQSQQSRIVSKLRKLHNRKAPLQLDRAPDMGQSGWARFG